jgi:hypothetical protein
VAASQSQEGRRATQIAQGVAWRSERKCVWTTGRFDTIFLPQVLMLPLNSGSDESKDMAREIEIFRTGGVALVESKTCRRNGSRVQQRNRVLMGRLKCSTPRCNLRCLNTDAGKLAFVKHALSNFAD